MTVAHGDGLLLSAGDFPDTRRAEGTVFAGVELDEMASRDVGATPLAGELAVPPDDFALEADVDAGRGSDHAVVAVQNATHLGSVENLAGEVRVGRNRLQAVHRVAERDLVVFEAGEQLDTEFDALVHTGRFGDDHKEFAGGDCL
jgi:hypothetical protein